MSDALLRPPTVIGLPLWRWMADAKVSLVAGTTLALHLAFLHMLSAPGDWWLPLTIMFLAMLPGVLQQANTAFARWKDENHALQIQQFESRIAALEADRVSDRELIHELRTDLAKSQHELADARQTIIAHEATISMLQGHLTDANSRLDGLAGGSVMQETLRTIELLTPPQEPQE